MFLSIERFSLKKVEDFLRLGYLDISLLRRIKDTNSLSFLKSFRVFFG